MTKNLLFISYLLEGNTQGVGYWLMAVGIMALLIVVASLFDLRYGIRASKRIGKFKTTSFGLRKTIAKDKDYLAVYFFSVMADSCLSFFVTFPVACICVAVGVIAIEGLSVREKIKEIGNAADPFSMAKCVANTYGVTDANKIEVLMKALQKEKEKEQKKKKETENEKE